MELSIPHCSVCLHSADLDLCCPNPACVMPYVCLLCRRLLSSPYYKCWLRPLSLEILQDAASGVNPRRTLLIDTPLPVASYQRRPFQSPSTESSASPPPPPPQPRQAAAARLSPLQYREITEVSSAGPSRTYIEIRDDSAEPEHGSRPDRAISVVDDGETPLAARPPPTTGEPRCPAGCGTRLLVVQEFREFDENEYTLPYMVQCPRSNGRLEQGLAVRIGTGNPLAEKLWGIHPKFRRAHAFLFVPVREGGPERGMREHFLLDEDPRCRIPILPDTGAQVPNPQWHILSPPFARA
ncbi:hypothetical protein IFR05_017447, partial [Cadophora sp. M221]